jgi:signal transduction histidine kinase/ActR/RegA family two-component response regulator
MNSSFAKNKEKSEEYFQNIVVECEKKLDEVGRSEELLGECMGKIRLFTPADFIYLIHIEYADGQYILEYDGKKKIISEKSSSILNESISRGHPLIANNLESSFIYSEEIDNLSDKYIKDIMVVPISSGEGNRPTSLIWIATDGGNWYQFTQKDLDFVVRYSNLIGRFSKIQKSEDDSSYQDEKLQNCLKMKQKLRDELKSRELYFSSIIHDIRTPMNAVIGFLDLLRLRESDSVNRRYIESALKSSEMMITLINDALDLSKISSGKMNIEKIEFSPIREFEDTVRIFANSAMKKSVCFSAYFDPAIPRKIVSDPTRIKQIVNNLLSNALKFVSDENGKIELRFEYDSDIDGLTVSVEDNGPGIDEKAREKIFMPFEQESESTTRKYGGTGLGLSIAMQLAVLLGGSLRLESEVGEGSRFYFTIPCNTPMMMGPSYDRESLEADNVALLRVGKCDNLIEDIESYLSYLTKNPMILSDSGLLVSEKFETLFIYIEEAVSNKEIIFDLIERGKRIVIVGCNNIAKDQCIFENKVHRLASPILPRDICHATHDDIDSIRYEKDKANMQKLDMRDKTALVVDDSPLNLNFMKEVMKVLQMQTLLASSADEAIEIYRDRHEDIDIVFMDENMGERSGSDAISEIRKYEKSVGLSEKPIIGLTGDTREDMIQKIKDAGANSVMGKPVRLNELESLLEIHLNKTNDKNGV